MPNYFIHLRGASDGANDPDGEEFANDAAAEEHVAAAIRRMIVDGLGANVDHSALVFEVRDQQERLVVTIPFVPCAPMETGKLSANGKPGPQASMAMSQMF